MGEFQFKEKGWVAITEAVRDDIIVPTLHQILMDARRFAPVLTGRLKRSLEAQLDDNMGGSVGSNVDYAASVELGAKPHDIPNAFGKTGFGVGGRFLGKFHPGNHAQPYLRPALYHTRGFFPGADEVDR